MRKVYSCAITGSRSSVPGRRGGYDQPVQSLTIRHVPGIRVGHWTDAERLTGCTVVLADDGGAVAGVDVRGSAPGTRETDLLRPTALVERINAVCLAGGSAFGLAAADGVMRRLAERGVGYATGVRPVPIVPATILFDLAVGDPGAFPDADAGHAATLAAESDDGPLEGRVGAGTGATVAKLSGGAG
ncbi:MAG: P1 family peptidase, partial [Chloroflexi bacterium]|nr:P1 family peptidase [Chloroflexota bacterium]